MSDLKVESEPNAPPTEAVAPPTEAGAGSVAPESGVASEVKRAIVVPGVARFATAPRLEEAPQLESISRISAREKKTLPAFKEYGGAEAPVPADSVGQIPAEQAATRESNPASPFGERHVPDNPNGVNMGVSQPAMLHTAPVSPSVSRPVALPLASVSPSATQPVALSSASMPPSDSQSVAGKQVAVSPNGSSSVAAGQAPSHHVLAEPSATPEDAGGANAAGTQPVAASQARSKKGKYDSEVPHQYYSDRMYERIKADVQRGKIWVRMQAPRVYRVIEGDDAMHTALVGGSLAKERSMLKNLRTLGWVLCVLDAVFCGFALKAFAPFVLLFLGWLYWFNLKHAREDCKDKGIYVWGGVIAVILGFIFKGHILIQSYAVFTVAVVLWPYFIYQKIRACCLQRFLQDYNFFRYVTGRPKDVPDRPPVVLIVPKTKTAAETINWDKNPKPELVEWQIESPYPTLIGRSYDFYFSAFHTRLFSFLVALVLGFGNVQNLLATAFGVALGFSVLYSFICPSKQFVEFRESRNAYGNEGDRLPTYFLWMTINVIWTTLCLYVMGWLIQHYWPVARPQVENLLDESFPSWRPMLQSILDLFGIKVKLTLG